ncbi:MAG TPA: hypothetical protein VFG20_23900 [Planctomycetaceae bacterium]|jgi:hypothetical protein|nr:hypothetical protein [Planctomycetaceae bacterium]
MRILVVSFSLFVAALGCSKQTSNAHVLQDRQDAPAIEAFGQRWKKIGFATDGEALSYRLSMIPTEYAGENPKVRLLELLPREGEAVFSRIFLVQILQNDRWINHGDSATWRLDGGRSESHFANGESHGIERHWHANGQLKIEREWVEGLEHGRTRGWYENGRPMFDLQYERDKKVSGKSWREDGTES